MAATSPKAVANSASAMPGATTARLVFFEAAVDRKLRNTPQAGADRREEGPGGAEGGDPREPPLEPLYLPADRHVHHFLDPLGEAGKRARPAFIGSLQLAHRRHEQGRD